jgi:hypothetical protein
MLTADGSTRAWRRLRDSVPGKPAGKAILHHKVPRYKGGSDSPSNLEWIKGGVGNDPYVGRPKGH